MLSASARFVLRNRMKKLYFIVIFTFDNQIEAIDSNLVQKEHKEFVTKFSIFMKVRTHFYSHSTGARNSADIKYSNFIT